MNEESLKQKLIDLAPWHFDMDVKFGLRTIDGNKKEYKNEDFRSVKTIDPKELQSLFFKIYPNGFKGKSFLDVGCNGGGYCLIAKQNGADRVFGFDVRDHWINQAKFLKDTLGYDNSIEFDVKHVEDLSLDIKYDITLFKGVFYHLPHPTYSLEHLCKITNEVMILDTAAKIGGDPNALYTVMESQTHVMSGVDKLSWIPGGPPILERLFKHFGFTETRVINWTKKQSGRARGRIRIIAARNRQFFKNFDQ